MSETTNRYRTWETANPYSITSIIRTTLQAPPVKQAKFEVSNTDPVARLLPGVLIEIFLHLRVEDLFLSCALVSKSWHDFLCGDFLWENLIIREFGPERAKIFLSKPGALKQFKQALLQNSPFRINFLKKGEGYLRIKSGLGFNEFLDTIRNRRPDFFRGSNEDKCSPVKSNKNSPAWFAIKLSSAICEAMDLLKLPLVYTSEPNSYVDQIMLFLLDCKLRPIFTISEMEFDKKARIISDYPPGVRYIFGCGIKGKSFRMGLPSCAKIMQLNCELKLEVSSAFVKSDFSDTEMVRILDTDPGILNYTRIPRDRFLASPLGMLAIRELPRTNKVLELFLRRGASFLPRAVEYAIRYDNVEAVKLFFEHGAKTEWKGEEGFPLLYYALAGDSMSTRMADFLIVKGAEINWCDEWGTTMLMYLANFGSIDAIRYIIEHGADVGRLNKQNKSALQFALNCANRFLPARLTILLEAGADANVKISRSDNTRTTCLIEAVLAYKPDAAKTLIEHGADVNARDGKGLTAADYAKNRNGKKALEIRSIFFK